MFGNYSIPAFVGSEITFLRPFVVIARKRLWKTLSKLSLINDVVPPISDLFVCS